MAQYDLSILIPARNEYYYDIDLLYETVTNVLINTSKRTELVVCLDGYWPKQPLPVDPRLRVIHHNQSIGQRAATNEAARVSSGEYLCKLDAHCALDENFDEKLLATFEPHWTVTPALFNLLVFIWKCKKCGWEKDQSPKPAKCGSCGSRYLKQVKEWRPRDGSDRTDVDRKGGRRKAYLHSWRFDSKLEYTQWGDFANRPDQQTPIHDTMSLLGACWAIRRERYFDLNICDENYGSWGQQGTEIACKTWLSGGELKCNTTTWFAHFFRVGGIGFPYSDGGRKERAMARCREQWLNNTWEKQVYPLSWLIEKFAPVPDWLDGNPTWELVKEAGKRFSFPLLSRDRTPLALASSTNSPSSLTQDEGMTLKADSFPSVNSRGNIAPFDVVPVVGLNNNVERVTTGLVLTDNVVQDGDISPPSHRQRLDKPSVHESMDQLNVPIVLDMAVAPLVFGASPDPAVGSFVNGNLTEDSSKSPSGQVPNSQGSSTHGLIIPQNQPRKGIIYYTCNSHDPTLELAARNNLKRATNGHEIGCVALQRTDFGDWTIVLDREKSGGTMHYQILAGLERSTADYVFLCESDVLYHRTHFDFCPPRDDTFYYNTNVWRIRYSDGHAVRTSSLQQVSGICANRLLLLDHYRKRVEIIEKSGGIFDVKRMAYEPGTRGRFGDEKIANWSSPYPNLDITGHGNTLTTPHFSVESFRNKKFAEGWMENDGQIEGWPLIYGRVQEWLKELANE